MNVLERIDALVANEADMAYRKRVRTVFEWLDLQAQDRVLDAGCGRGFYLHFARQLSEARLWGIELIEERIAMARKALEGTPRLQLLQANLLALPFGDASFDKIILSEVAEHVEDDVGLLRELSRVLVPGGRIAITVPNANYPFWWDPLNKSLETLFQTHVSKGPLAGIWAEHVRLYTLEQLRSAVRSAGLEIAQERSFTHHCFPFIHNLVYGLGKEALEAGLVPKSLAATADRHQLGQSRGGPFNPVRWGLATFEWFDRNNRIDEPAGRSTVNLAALAVKPH